MSEIEERKTEEGKVKEGGRKEGGMGYIMLQNKCIWIILQYILVIIIKNADNGVMMCMTNFNNCTTFKQNNELLVDQVRSIGMATTDCDIIKCISNGALVQFNDPKN